MARQRVTQQRDLNVFVDNQLTIAAIESAEKKVESLIEKVQQERLQKRLDKQVARAYPDGGWDAYQQAIEQAGNPDDQMENFHQAGLVLQPKQLQFAAWARRADDPDGPNEIGMGGARGPGKSFALFAQIAVDDCQRFAGLKVLYLRKSGKAANEQMIDLMGAVLSQFDYRYRERPSGLLQFQNGSRIIIGHFKTEDEALTYQGLEYDIVVIEETTHLSEDAYKALRLSARTSKDWRTRAYNSTNPLGTGHQWYKKRFVDPERGKRDKVGKTKFIFATVEDNNFVDDDYEDNLNDLTGAKYRAFRLGDWDVSAGAYFDMWRESVHVIDNITEIPPEWDFWMSMDYGYRHWNTIYLHVKTGDGMVYTIYELTHRRKHVEQIAPDVLAMLDEFGLNVRLCAMFSGSDTFRSTGRSRQTIAQRYAAFGITMRHADVSPGSRAAGAEHLSQLLGDPERGIAPSWQICRRCKRLIDTIPYLEVDPNHPEDVRKVDANKDGEGGDDGYDGARYGLYRPHTSSIASGSR